MGRGKKLQELRHLPEEVLSEVVREGEMRLAAQFAAAAAADQRAMSWFSLLVTITIAALGGAATLLVSGRFFYVAMTLLLFSFALLVASFKAVECVRPRLFSFPGNLPENWLPERWQDPDKLDIVQARVEQSICLNNAIDDNKRLADAAGRNLQHSINVTIWALLLTIVSLAVAAMFESR